MKVNSNILKSMTLNERHTLLNLKQARVILEIFNILDLHENNSLNDIIVWKFLEHFTDLSKSQIYAVFNFLDADRSGEVDFNEFYLMACILVAVKEHREKEFIYRHAKVVFMLLDLDASGTVSCGEFTSTGFLFSFYKNAVESIFNEFDISGDQVLDYEEFKLFTVACIDEQRRLEMMQVEEDAKRKQKHFFDNYKGLLNAYMMNTQQPDYDRKDLMSLWEKVERSPTGLKGKRSIPFLETIRQWAPVRFLIRLFLVTDEETIELERKEKERIKWGKEDMKQQEADPTLKGVVIVPNSVRQ